MGGQRRQHCRPGASARGRRPPQAGTRRRKEGVEHPEDEALGRSRGGLSTKVPLACDGKGRPLSVVVTPGQRHQSTQLEAVLDAIRVARLGVRRPRKRPERLIVDKGYGSGLPRNVGDRLRVFFQEYSSFALHRCFVSYPYPPPHHPVESNLAPVERSGYGFSEKPLEAATTFALVAGDSRIRHRISSNQTPCHTLLRTSSGRLLLTTQKVPGVRSGKAELPKKTRSQHSRSRVA